MMILLSDSISSPAGATRPSARLISNTVSDEPVDIPNARNMSDWVYAWGQFIDHDLDLTTTGDTAFDIPVPQGDPFFDPASTGTARDLFLAFHLRSQHWNSGTQSAPGSLHH